MTNERAEILVSFLKEDNDRASKIFELAANVSVEAAAKEVNKYGYDFSGEEIEDLMDQLAAVSAAGTNGELDADALENVSGGLVITTAVIGYWVVCAGAGAAAALVNWKRRK